MLDTINQYIDLNTLRGQLTQTAESISQGSRIIPAIIGYFVVIVALIILTRHMAAKYITILGRYRQMMQTILYRCSLAIADNAASIDDPAQTLPLLSHHKQSLLQGQYPSLNEAHDQLLQEAQYIQDFFSTPVFLGQEVQTLDQYRSFFESGYSTYRSLLGLTTILSIGIGRLFITPIQPLSSHRHIPQD